MYIKQCSSVTISGTICHNSCKYYLLMDSSAASVPMVQRLNTDAYVGALEYMIEYRNTQSIIALVLKSCRGSYIRYIHTIYEGMWRGIHIHMCGLTNETTVEDHLHIPPKDSAYSVMFQ